LHREPTLQSYNMYIYWYIWLFIIIGTFQQRFKKMHEKINEWNKPKDRSAYLLGFSSLKWEKTPHNRKVMQFEKL